MTSPTTPKPSMAQEFCAVCKKEGGGKDGIVLLLCGKCNSASYCSRDCQVVDRKLHRMLCADFSAGVRPLDKEGRPCRRCIYFPDDKHLPELFWIAPQSMGSILDKFHGPSIKEKFKRGEIAAGELVCKYRLNAAYPGKVNEVLNVVCKANQPVGNHSLYFSCIALGHDCYGDCRGPVFLVRRQKHLLTPGVALFSDVTLTDFRIMVENSCTKWSKDMTGFNHLTGYYSVSGEQTSWEAAMGPGWVEEPTSKVITTGLVAAGVVRDTIPEEAAAEEVVAQENHAEETVPNTRPDSWTDLRVKPLDVEAFRKAHASYAGEASVVKAVTDQAVVMEAAAELSVDELSAERVLIRGGCIRNITDAILLDALANCRTQESVIESTLIQLCARITMVEELVEARIKKVYSEEVLLQSSGLLLRILEPFLSS